MKEMVLVSACLLGVNCKYNGQNNRNEKVFHYLEDKIAIPICPEQLGGLPTPRMSAERLHNQVIRKDGVDVTKEYEKGALETLRLAKYYGIKKAVLKARSPSCGVGMIYDGTFSHQTVKRDGVTAQILKENGFEVMTEEDL